MATWKILQKGGKPGWAALIPVYNQWVLSELVEVWPWWVIIVLGCSLVGSAIPVVGSLISMAASIYFAVLLNVSLARAFGKEDSFAVGLVLLNTIFTLILGFGKSEYHLEGNPKVNDYYMIKYGTGTDLIEYPLPEFGETKNDDYIIKDFLKVITY